MQNLREKLGISGLLLMYVGNLEAYQGINLLLASFSLILQKTDKVDLVIIGGEIADIQQYQTKVRCFNIDHKVHFLGPKPIEDLAEYLSQADILVSPRIKGNNTPMKIYSYLDSGKPVLATNLATHTQLLDNRVAMLAEPAPEMFAKGMQHLIEDETLRQKLGTAGKKLIQEKYSYTAFCEKINALFDWLQTEIEQEYSLITNKNKGVAAKPEVL